MSITVQHRRDTRAVIEAVTPAEGEIGYDKDLKALRAGDGATLGGSLHKLWGKSYTLSPAQLTASQNDYNPTDLKIAEAVILDLSANWTITGLAGGATNREISIYNSSSFRLTLTNEDAASTAANRFHFGQAIVLRPFQGLRLIYSTALSRWVAIGRQELGITDLPEAVTLSGECRPAQVTGNQNDWDPADGTSALAWSSSRASTIYVSTDASHNVTGIAGGVKGRLAVIINSGTNPLVLKNGDVGSTAANRFDMSADVTLAGKQSAIFEYDTTASRWKMLANTAGGAVADGAVTAAKLASSAIAARAGMINGTIVESHAGSAVTFALKTLLGVDPSAADPVYFVFQNGSGAYVVRSVTAALSVTVSSGSSLGVANNNSAFRVRIVALDNAGTVALGAINTVSGINVLPMPTHATYSSTAEGGAGAADNAQTIYTPGAIASKFLCHVGFADYNAGLAAVGTWNVAPSLVVVADASTPLPGQEVQSAIAQTGAGATGTTVIPFDDTIPQNTEGSQYMSVTLTPNAAPNLLEAAAVFNYSQSGTAPQLTTMAIFRDSNANAGPVAWTDDPRANDLNQLLINGYRELAGSTAATTFKLRAGTANAATLSFNGQFSARVYGGNLSSTLRIREIAA